MTIVKKRKMQFYGHTNRAGNLATTILQGSVDGKRERKRKAPYNMGEKHSRLDRPGN